MPVLQYVMLIEEGSVDASLGKLIEVTVEADKVTHCSGPGQLG